jgi:hypothetical protein
MSSPAKVPPNSTLTTERAASKSSTSSMSPSDASTAIAQVQQVDLQREHAGRTAVGA